MEQQLDGRVAVVIGAGERLGRVMVRALANEGATVVAVGYKSAPEEGLVEDRIVPMEADITQALDVERIKQKAEQLGGLHILIHDVGAATRREKGFLRVGDAVWRETMELSLFAPLMVTRYMLPLLRDSGRGTVISVSSIDISRPDPAYVDYAASRAAMSNVMTALAREYGARGVRFHTVTDEDPQKSDELAGFVLNLVAEDRPLVSGDVHHDWTCDV